MKKSYDKFSNIDLMVKLFEKHNFSKGMQK